jgi:4-hydroxyphenylpyruvate dioxygenase
MKIDHVHFYVEDAKASRDWFVQKLGFQPVAAVSCDHTCTEVVNSGLVDFVLSSPLTSASPVAEFLRSHPSGVADVAFRVSDVASVMEKAVSGGAKVLEPIQKQQLAQGCLQWGKIAAWGTLSHTLIERSGITPLLPQSLLQKIQNPVNINHGVKFSQIDHVVLNVAAGDLAKAVAWYENVLGFQRQQVFNIQTDESGLRSQVMMHSHGSVQLPINEPTSPNSQIQEFLDVNQGAGIQHMALRTLDLVQALTHLRAWGLSFIQVPPTYYTQLQHRQPQDYLSPEQWEAIIAQEILVDWQDDAPEALLLQTFTQPIFSKPTFFFELIERRLQVQGFGERNFRALFEAIEREQVKRGSLVSESL